MYGGKEMTVECTERAMRIMENLLKEIYDEGYDAGYDTAQETVFEWFDPSDSRNEGYD